MAEILDENVERFSVDTPSGSGNTVLGTADPSDSNTEGIARSAGESGVFLHTDKSFSIYFCYGSTWELYGTLSSEDADFEGGVSIPWVTHATHGASTAMYFKTEETDHVLRAVPLSGALITDFIPGDADLTKDTVIFDETAVTIGSTTLDGVGVYFKPTQDLSGKLAGDTVSFTLNGEVAGAITFMDEFTQIKTTITYDAETGMSTISYILPVSYDGSQDISTYVRGGSPLSDPFTRSVQVPTSGLNYHMNMNVDPQDGGGSFPDDGVGVTAFGGDGSSAANTGSPIRYYSIYQWGDGGNTVDVNNAFLDFTSNKLLTPNGLDFSSEGATVAFAMVDGRYDATSSAWLRFTDANQKGIQFQFEKSGHSSKIKVYFRLNAANTKYAFISDDYVITDTAMHTVVATADGDGNLTVKVDGAAIEMSSMAVPNVGWTPHINGHFFLGDYAAYDGVLAGTDLEQLQSYFDFKYTNLPSEENMGESHSEELNVNTYTSGNGFLIDGGDHNYSGWMENDKTGFTATASTNKAYNTTTPIKKVKAGTKFTFEATDLVNSKDLFIIPISEWERVQGRIGIDPYALLRYQGVGGHDIMLHHTGHSRVYESVSTPSVLWDQPSHTDGWATSFTMGFMYNPYAPGANVPQKVVVEWDGTLKYYRNNVLEYTSSIKVEEDFIVIYDGEAEVKVTGYFEDLTNSEFIEGEGDYVTFEAYGTNTGVYNNDTEAFGGNAANGQCRAKKKMLPGSWLEFDQVTEEGGGPYNNFRPGLRPLLMDADYSASPSTVNLTNALWGLHNHNYSMYHLGQNFNRTDAYSVYHKYSDYGLNYNAAYDNAKRQPRGFYVPTWGPSNNDHVKSGEHKMRIQWTEDKKLQYWIVDPVKGNFLIHQMEGSIMTTALTALDALYPWVWWGGNYYLGGIRIIMGGNLADY